MESAVHTLLANIWFALVGLILALYVILDGFDLGVGILSLVAGDEERRGIMMTSLGSVWDANETWLVLLGGALFGAFPAVYAVLLHALYLPILIMIGGLILRGVAFEFREHAHRKLPWNLAFGIGSVLAAACQGCALGTLIQGIPVTDGRFAGSVWDWVKPFPLLVAAGVMCGYTLLGATYLIIRTEGRDQHRSRRWAKWSAWLMMAAMLAVTLWTPLLGSHVARRWFTAPLSLALLPAVAGLAFAMLQRALQRHYEHAPFFWSVAIFVASFTGLAISFYPFLIPPELIVWEAASSGQTLVFMLTGIGMLLPVMLIYNAYQYLVFRGKIKIGGYSADTFTPPPGAGSGGDLAAQESRPRS
jgi:cytochrome d ubiquinol oxidase subunit II